MAQTKLEQLHDELKAAQDAVNTRREEIIARAHDKFAEAGGCETCRGRGWVVTWDTLDCMRGSYHEHARCPAEGCTPDSRAVSGLAPINNKYDKFHNSVWQMSLADANQLVELERIARAAHENIRLEEAKWYPSKGKLVRVTKEGRGKKKFRTPVGTEGMVARVFVNDYGTEKAVIITREGEKFFPTTNSLEVIDTDPDTTPWDTMQRQELERNGVPVFMTVKRIGPKAALVIAMGQTQEQWLPISQVPDLVGAEIGKMTTALVPAWLAKQKGFEIAGSK